MNLASFVRLNRPRWKKLEELLGDLETAQINTLDRDSIRELSQLYRSCTSDLAYAETYFQGTTLLVFLHQLVGRAHHQIYRTDDFSLVGLAQFFRKTVPAAARAGKPHLIFAAMVFLGAFVFGLAAAGFNERVAWLFLPADVIEGILAGQMWTQGIFNAMPGAVMSSYIFSNNAAVALMLLAGGLTCGIYTFLVLAMNGFILGVVFKLCATHGLMGPLLEFVMSHGLLEISAIITAAAAGFILAEALLNPGNYSRKDAVTLRGKPAVQLALGCLFPLFAAGLVEGFVSPASNIPWWFKVFLGVLLVAAFWGYLFFAGNKEKKIRAIRTTRPVFTAGRPA